MTRTNSLFAYEDYRKAILFALERSERQGKKVLYQTIAENIRVQKSYFSKVMNGYADLSSDQMFLFCQFLDLSSSESEFLLLLLEFERSAIAERKSEINDRLEAIRKIELDTGKQLGNETPKTSSEVGNYYMNPYLQIVNQGLEIEAFAKNPEKLRQQLNLSEQYFHELLKTLEADSFIEYAGGEYKSLGREFHLPKQNALFTLWINKQRMMSLSKMTSLPVDDFFSFDILFTASDAGIKKIQDRFRSFLEDAREIAIRSKKEKVFQMGFDLLPWTEKPSK